MKVKVPCAHEQFGDLGALEPFVAPGHSSPPCKATLQLGPESVEVTRP
jgi:hypothetical protein